MSVNVIFEAFSVIAFSGAIFLFTLVLFEKTALFKQHYHAKLLLAAFLGLGLTVSTKALSKNASAAPNFTNIVKKIEIVEEPSPALKAKVILPIPIHFN